MSSTRPLPGTIPGPLKLTGIEVRNGNVTVGGDLSVVNNVPSTNTLEGQIIYFNVRGVPTSFQERKPEMEKLTSAFQSAVSPGGKKTKETNTLIIYGAPGAGKTSLAASFVDHHGKELEDFHVLWIAADSKRGIRDQFVQACEHHLQGLSLRDKEGQFLKDDLVMSNIYNQLSRRKSLIIFDNAASGIKNYGIKEEIGDFFPKSVQPRNYHPVFLITTRTDAPEAWKGCNKNMVHLGSFSWEDCWAYMTKELSLLGRYEDGCRRLWEFFNGLPIAIEQAVNVMMYEASDDEANYNPGKFINKALAFQPTSLESIQGMDMELYERLNCLWDYSMELIRNVPHVGEFAIHVLDVMAMLSPTGIPHNFLLEIIKGYIIWENEGFETSNDEENIDKRVSKVAGILKKFSIVQKSDKLLYIHVLLQEHRRKCLKKENRLGGHVVAIAGSMIAIPELTSYMRKDEYAHNFKNIDRVCNAILEYVQDEAEELKIICAAYVVDILPKTALKLLVTVRDTVETLEIKSDCYLNVGSFNQALQHAQQCCSNSDLEVGRDNQKILRNKNRLATVLCKLGNYTEALVLSKEVHDSYSCILGEEHPYTLNAKNNLANTYSDLGNYAKALGLSKEVHGSRCRILGGEHPDTLRAKNNMAAFHSHLGNYAEALGLSKEVYDSYSCILGEEHPDTLRAKNNLANRYSDLGNDAEALGLSQEVHDSYSRILGEEHPDTLRAKNNMTAFHSNLGNYAEALGLSKEVHDSYSCVLGEEHPYTLIAKNNLANSYSDLGYCAEALALSKEVHDSRCRILGEEHPDTLRAKHNLGAFHLYLGNYAEALGLSKEVYDSDSRILGEEHPYTLRAKNNLANCYSDLGNYAKALGLSKEVHDSRCRILGEEHPDTLRAKNNLADFHSDLGYYAEALALSKEVHDSYFSILGVEHPYTLRAKNNLANRYSDLGNYAEALGLSKEVHASYSRILGEEHPVTLSAKNIMASHHSHLGNYAEALVLSKEVHASYSRILGEEHLVTWSAANIMASHHSYLGNYAKALALSKEVHDFYSRIFGEEHPHTLSAKNIMASHHSFIGNYAEALALSKEVHGSRCRILGGEHPDTLRAKNNMAAFHSHLGNYAEALGLSKEVHDSYCRILGEEHPASLRTKSLTQDLEVKCGECQPFVIKACSLLASIYPGIRGIAFISFSVVILLMFSLYRTELSCACCAAHNYFLQVCW